MQKLPLQQASELREKLLKEKIRAARLRKSESGESGGGGGGGG